VLEHQRWIIEAFGKVEKPIVVAAALGQGEQLARNTPTLVPPAGSTKILFAAARLFPANSMRRTGCTRRRMAFSAKRRRRAVGPARYPAFLPGVAAFLAGAVAFFTAAVGGGTTASRASRSVRSRAIFSCTARLSARYSAIAFSPSRSRSAFLDAALARAWSFVCLEANSNLLSM
jgi:hypothetical protein